MKRLITIIAITVISLVGFSQEEDSETAQSNIQKYTPSKLIDKGQWDVKFFNNLYTQTKQTGASENNEEDIDRQTFFTSTLEIFTGVSQNNRVSIGGIIEYLSLIHI